jgi:outer membrane protein OmpU
VRSAHFSFRHIKKNARKIPFWALWRKTKMKKVLLAGTALLGMALAASPAAAELNLDLGGLFRGYVVNNSDDTVDTRELDFRRDSEIHFTGETTLDNGLTVGVHAEQDLGGDVVTDEIYAYFQGGWGRVNFGSEDGAAYLLQAAAPSADSNVDGLRTYIQGYPDADVDFVRLTGVAGVGTYSINASDVDGSPTIAGPVDYDHADFANTDRITYLTPKFSGFQAGFSYAPEEGQNAVGNNIAAMASDADVEDYEDLFEVAARWDGEFSGFGLTLGAGYSSADVEANSGLGALAAGDVEQGDLDRWNVGGSVAFNSFSFGAAYNQGTQDYLADVADGGVEELSSGEVESQTWVVGAGWDNGPYHVGASYLNTQFDNSGASIAAAVAAGDVTIASSEQEVEKITVGAGYTFGPGMTFRGAVAFGEVEAAAVTAGVGNSISNTSNDFTQITVGTDIQF